MTKVTVNIPESSCEKVVRMAALRGKSRADIINEAIMVYSILVENQTVGGKSVIQLPNGELKEVIVK